MNGPGRRWCRIYLPPRARQIKLRSKRPNNQITTRRMYGCNETGTTSVNLKGSVDLTSMAVSRSLIPSLALPATRFGQEVAAARIRIRRHAVCRLHAITSTWAARFGPCQPMNQSVLKSGAVRQSLPAPEIKWKNKAKP
jgi:hypothetical protein